MQKLSLSVDIEIRISLRLKTETCKRSKDRENKTGNDDPQHTGDIKTAVLFTKLVQNNVPHLSYLPTHPTSRIYLGVGTHFSTGVRVFEDRREGMMERERDGTNTPKHLNKKC
ncbi:hypothetical protein C0Q70_10614 [Pomacea canaliculata]|uniref:Uncharacterized protein n=1 Tax=Pomacea canaliculata TaxID=400727 RepID=A0A2T7P3Q8_POMCA|nr:hypothetical protein C0Q70_10614 [Pomacea canaliculata]